MRPSLLPLALLLGADPALPAAEALQARHLAAIGGPEAVARLAGHALSGTIEVEGQTGQLRLAWDRLGGFERLASLPGGLSLGQGVVDGIAWSSDPGIRFTVGADRLLLLQEADPTGARYPAAHYWHARTIAQEEMCGTDSWRVQLDHPDGYTAITWYALDSGLRVGFQAPAEIDTEADLTCFSDWKALDGLLLPMRREGKSGGLEIHTQLDPSFTDQSSPLVLPLAITSASWHPGEPAWAVHLPLIFRQGLPTLQVRIGQSVLRLIVDTGANVNALSPAAAATLGLDSDLLLSGNGAGGEIADVPVVALPPLDIGGHTFPGQAAVIADLGVERVDGLLGAGFLGAVTLEIDPAAHEISLRPRGIAASGKLDLSGLTRLPLHLYEGGLARVELSLEGDPPMPALVDTGAQRTTITWAAARARGLRVGDPALKWAGEAVGADGRRIVLWEHRFVSLALGALQFQDTPLTVGNLPALRRHFGAGPAALLGMDLLGGRHLLLDPAEPALYLGP